MRWTPIRAGLVASLRGDRTHIDLEWQVWLFPRSTACVESVRRLRRVAGEIVEIPAGQSVKDERPPIIREADEIRRALEDIAAAGSTGLVDIEAITAHSNREQLRLVEGGDQVSNVLEQAAANLRQKNFRLIRGGRSTPGA